MSSILSKPMTVALFSLILISAGPYSFGQVLGEFSIAVAPANIVINAFAGSTPQAQATVTVTSISGFSGSVALSASGLPQGFTATFNPSTVTVTPAVQSQSSIVLITAAGVPTTPTTITVTITGSSADLTRIAQLILSINPAIPGFPVEAVSLGLAAGLLVVFAVNKRKQRKLT